MTIPLAAVCDLDVIASRSPLVLDLASTERYVYGAEAIAQRVLIAWAESARLLDLEGTSSAAERFRLRSRLAALAEDVEFVTSARVSVELTGSPSALAISAALVLEDGTEAQLEVATGDAVALLLMEAT